MEYRKGSISKPEPERINEDTVSELYGEGEKRHFALSDGAGGVGIFAEIWSATLVEKIKTQSTPFATLEELDVWIGSFAEEYIQTQTPTLSENRYVRQKFEQEGSYATLAACWVSAQKGIFCLYGDSCAFHWNGTTLTLYPEKYREDAAFHHAPYLIGIYEPLVKGFEKEEISCQKGDFLILASDAFSRFLLKISQEKDVKDWIEALWLALETKESFENFCTELYNSKQLPPDDWSVGMLKMID
jgi:serine/threonine protein phosphatase PrpC